MTQWYAPRSGGIRTYLHAKAAYAQAHRFAHAIVVPGASSGVGRVHGSPLVELAGMPTGQTTGYRLIPHPAPITRVLDRLAPSVLVIHDATAFPRTLVRWARARSIPVALMVHSELQTATPAAPAPVRLPTQHLLRLLQDRGLEGPDAVITASEAVAARLRQRRASPAFVSHLGVDTEVFRPRPVDHAMRRVMAEPHESLVVHAGRMSAEKHPQLLVEALASAGSDVVLAIAGEGSAMPDLRDATHRLGVTHRLRLLGHIAAPESLARLFATADCYLHANPAEPFGLAALEALACGCRVVLPRDAGAAEAMLPHEAVRVAPGSAAALAAGIREALRGPRPKPDATRLAWQRSFDREWALYRSLASRSAQGWAAA